MLRLGLAHLEDIELVPSINLPPSSSIGQIQEDAEVAEATKLPKAFPKHLQLKFLRVLRVLCGKKRRSKCQWMCSGAPRTATPITRQRRRGSRPAA